MLRSRIRMRHYSVRTEKVYSHWVRRYILFHGKRHPREMGAAEVTSFLSALADDGGISPNTQNQAMSAILFLYKEVLQIELPWLDGVHRAKKGAHLPTVLTQTEVRRLLAQMEGVFGLMARLMYGTGLRLMECVRLRVKDLDLERRQVMVRHGKGGRDRITVLPETLVGPLNDHLARVRDLFLSDRQRDVPGVELPFALVRKMPSAGKQMGMDVGFPVAHPFPRSAHAYSTAPSRLRAGSPACDLAGRTSGADLEARFVACAAAFIRHPSHGIGL